ncbi:MULTISPECIES: hypothetical protein [Arthrobacter]|uniref:Uncharacterized protein n=2 Tax=Arthrobacter TaxID=1663 RepID=A0ABU9KNK2_9MICC|nr:hypothetical protein [Arthrobacter sp. YJM1]MDP5228508.1 hypothetical protein [Arthrobacter sp. YJM1]
MDDELAAQAQDSVQDPAVKAVLRTLKAVEEAPLHEHPAALDAVHDQLSALLDGPLVPGVQA